MRKKVYTCIAILCAVAVLIAIYCVVCVSLEDQVVWEKTSVNGVSLEGLSKKEAGEAVQAKFQEEYQDAAMVVSIGDQEYQVNIFPVLGLDASEEIDQAYGLGHGAWYTRAVDWVRKQLQGEKMQEIEVLPTAENEDKLGEVLESVDIQAFNSVVESSWEVGESSLVIHKGSSGVAANMEELEERILQAIEEQEYTASLECPVEETKPAEIDFQKIYEEVYREPVNATWDASNGYEVVPGTNGVSFDLESARAVYEAAAEGEDVEIQFETVEPEITTEDLEGKLFRDVLSSYSTEGGGTESRIQNITLAAQSCDGVVLMPGETFSYNDTVGERTVERGYQEASAYNNNQVVQEVGGGICQVSSTIFAAVLGTDLDIVERVNHSLTVSYMPMGMDATVSWGGPDLKFRNNTDYPVQLSVTYEDGVVSAQVIGTKEDSGSIQVTTEETGALSATTYRNYYDEEGNLISKVEVATSQYQNAS